MKNAGELWLRGAWKWWLPLVFLALNAALLAIYLWTFAGRVGALEESFRQGERDLEGMAEARSNVVGFLERVKTQGTAVDTLYNDYFSTEPRRFTTAIKEVKALAAKAHLNPSSLTYPRKVDEANGLVHRNVNFSVKGTYDDLRNFINFLELTDQFLALESISLSAGDDQRDSRLGIRLSLSTMFTSNGEDLTIEESPSESPGTVLGGTASDEAAAKETEADADGVDEEAAAEESSRLNVEAEEET